MSALSTEVRMVASTVAGLLPGRKVWMPPARPLDQSWVDSAKPAVLELASNELRASYAGEVEGLERVRQRSQFALTALVAGAGISASTAEDALIKGASWIAKAMWSTGFVIVVIACLIFAGVFVARKVVGVPTVDDLGKLRASEANRELAKSYERAIEITRTTRSAALTVFRDGVLLGLVGLALIVGANGVIVLTATPDTTQGFTPTPTASSSPAAPSATPAPRSTTTPAVTSTIPAVPAMPAPSTTAP